MRIPSHVPPELVLDFDMYDVPGISEDAQLAWKNALQGKDVVYTPRNGGHWVFARAEDIEALFRDFGRLSNSSIIIPAHDSPIKMIPDQSDPPDHSFYRKAVADVFSASEIAKREPEIRELTVELIEGFRRRGCCEFIGEFATALPIILFLRIMGLPEADRKSLLASSTRMMRATDGVTKTAAFQEILTYLSAQIDRRQAEPSSDLISRILSADVDGRRMTAQEALGTCGDLLLGGSTRSLPCSALSRGSSQTVPTSVRKSAEIRGRCRA